MENEMKCSIEVMEKMLLEDGGRHGPSRTSL